MTIQNVNVFIKRNLLNVCYFMLFGYSGNRRCSNPWGEGKKERTYGELALFLYHTKVTSQLILPRAVAIDSDS